MTVQATDNPGTEAVRRSAQVKVTIIVERNPNGPIFDTTSYSATITEYTAVDDMVVQVFASDADSPNVSGIYGSIIIQIFLESSF